MSGSVSKEFLAVAPDDAFALLGVARNPAPDPGEIDARFRELAKANHPDAPGGSPFAFARLAEARRILRDPARRLEHLAGLVGGGRPPPVPPPDTDLAFRIASASAEVAAAASAVSSAESAVASALAARRAAAASAGARRAFEDASALADALRRRLDDVAARWPADVTAEDLSSLASDMRYAHRWLDQARAACGET